MMMGEEARVSQRKRGNQQIPYDHDVVYRGDEGHNSISLDEYFTSSRPVREPPSCRKKKKKQSSSSRGRSPTPNKKINKKKNKKSKDPYKITKLDRQFSQSSAPPPALMSSFTDLSTSSEDTMVASKTTIDGRFVDENLIFMEGRFSRLESKMNKVEQENEMLRAEVERLRALQDDEQCTIQTLEDSQIDLQHDLHELERSRDRLERENKFLRKKIWMRDAENARLQEQLNNASSSSMLSTGYLTDDGDFSIVPHDGNLMRYRHSPQEREQQEEPQRTKQQQLPPTKNRARGSEQSAKKLTCEEGPNRRQDSGRFGFKEFAMMMFAEETEATHKTIVQRKSTSEIPMARTLEKPTRRQMSWSILPSA